MTSDWQRVQISDVCDLIVDCVNKTAPRVGYPTPYKMIRTPNVKGGRVDLTDCRFVEKDVYEKWTRRAKVLPGDVLLTREAPMGEVGYVNSDDTIFLGQRIMQYRANKDILDPRFLLYSFLSSDLQNQFRMHDGSGSVVSHIRVPDCSKFKLNLPPLQEQRKIVDILGAIDDKIELNRHNNQTLEQIAQAIFKSWFVDFDPVKAKVEAKAACRDPERAAMCAISGKSEVEFDQLSAEQHKQLAATAALFSDELVESELGLIPVGWKACLLSEMIEIIGGGTPKKSEPSFWGGDISWFSVKDAPADSDVFVMDTCEKITQAGLDKSSTKLLSEGTTIISARGTVGKLALVGTHMAMNQSCYGVVGVHGIGPFYNYFNLKQAVETLRQNTHGAVFDTITRSTFETVKTVKGNSDLMFMFDDLVSGLMQRIKENLRETDVLSELRNTLLPKLLCGKISLNKAEEQTESAVILGP